MILHQRTWYFLVKAPQLGQCTMSSRSTIDSGLALSPHKSSRVRSTSDDQMSPDICQQRLEQFHASIVITSTVAEESLKRLRVRCRIRQKILAQKLLRMTSLTSWLVATRANAKYIDRQSKKYICIIARLLTASSG